MRVFSLVALSCIGLVMAGCAGNSASVQANPAPCPNVIVLNEAGRLIEFDGEERLEDVAYSAEFVNVGTACRYFADVPIKAEVEIELAFGQGPKGENTEKEFTYFVAVVRRDLEVIAKNEFVVPVEFDDKKQIVVKTEKIDDIVIPRSGENISGSNFEIVVGFSLSREQVIFNRSGKSLKYPNL